VAHQAVAHGIIMVNVFDNANTQIPMENRFAIFGNASIADMEANRLITFGAQQPPFQKGSMLLKKSPASHEKSCVEKMTRLKAL
jgi:hypothetical protein